MISDVPNHWQLSLKFQALVEHSAKQKQVNLSKVPSKVLRVAHTCAVRLFNSASSLKAQLTEDVPLRTEQLLLGIVEPEKALFPCQAKGYPIRMR